MKRIESVNDFVIKFANVNGSGSASANELFAKAILRMGVPVSPRNIFPSNIQGLPTWYEVRVSERGWLGRRGGIDMMVAMNPQTWEQDVAEVETGGYLFYDSTRALPPESFRDDLTIIGMPVTAICNATYEDSRQRQLFKNIMVLGALSALMEVDAAVIEKLFSEQYRGKERLLESNVRALHAGRGFARDHLKPPIGLRVKPADRVGKKIFVDGNAAAALGCVYGGATVCAWYPITPSSSVAEAFDKYCRKYRVDAQTGENQFAIVQAEDEIASIGIVTGAGWNGARAFTATSGPGVSLMTEFIGLAYFAEIPLTIINVQRGGPSTGMPTRTQQADLLASAYASHGDTKHVMLLPQDPAECFEFAATALDLADRLQTPVFVMTDLDIGMNQRLCEPFVWTDERRYDRGKVMSALDLADRLQTPVFVMTDLDIGMNQRLCEPFVWTDERRYDRGKLMSALDLEAGREFGRYKDVDGDGIPWRTLPGTHPELGAYFTRGTTRDAFARYSEAGPDYLYNVQRLLKKFATAATLVPPPLVRAAARKTRLGVLHFGSTAPAMDEALEALAESGIHLDAMRLRAFPFAASVAEFIASHDQVFVVEQNRDAQMRTLLINELEIDPARLIRVLHYDGTPITARFITEAITKQVHALAVQPRRERAV
jgi:2-oxoglutarate ferredoxin oxidoreductase subunit alpha